jgi:hypothetical protein
MLRNRRFGLVSLAALLGVGATLLLAGVPVAPARTSRPAKMTVGVSVVRFTTNGRKLRATGTVSARITDNHGHVKTARTTVVIDASTGGGGCRVLHLFLNQLHLDLLGLHAHLDKVNLNITGNPRGGVLGSLFCKLARAKVKTARAKAARALSNGIRRHQGHALRFTAYFSPATTANTAANATCPVLDLIVGPLNLQLLGLVVDLNKVHLSITATRGQGTLGDTFCKLADNTTTTTTAAATSPGG